MRLTDPILYWYNLIDNIGGFMALIIIEGLDKVGKSTVADYFKDIHGYEYIHMFAPKTTSRDIYLSEMFTVIANTVGKDVVMDRSYYGELVWPHVYGRTPMLYHYDMGLLDSMCEVLHHNFQKIYMYDSNKNAHMERILKFKEPSYDYDLASQLYESAMTDCDFTFLTFQEAEAKGWTLKKD